MQVIKLAQYLHRAEVAINRGAEGKVGKVFVGDITEERAVELASKFVSEGFLFMVQYYIQTLTIQTRSPPHILKRS